MIVLGEVNAPLVLQIVIAVLLPALVGLITTRLTPGWQKSALLVGMTSISSVAAELAQALQMKTEFRVADVLTVAAGSYVLSMAIHLGVMRPMNVADKLADVGITADPRLAALAVASAPVLTRQGPISKEQLGAEIDWAQQTEHRPTVQVVLPPNPELWDDPRTPEHDLTSQLLDVVERVDTNPQLLVQEWQIDPDAPRHRAKRSGE